MFRRGNGAMGRLHRAEWVVRGKDETMRVEWGERGRGVVILFIYIFIYIYLFIYIVLSLQDFTLVKKITRNQI